MLPRYTYMPSSIAVCDTGGMWITVTARCPKCELTFSMPSDRSYSGDPDHLAEYFADFIFPRHHIGDAL